MSAAALLTILQGCVEAHITNGGKSAERLKPLSCVAYVAVAALEPTCLILCMACPLAGCQLLRIIVLSFRALAQHQYDWRQTCTSPPLGWRWLRPHLLITKCGAAGLVNICLMLHMACKVVSCCMCLFARQGMHTSPLAARLQNCSFSSLVASGDMCIPCLANSHLPQLSTVQAMSLNIVPLSSNVHCCNDVQGLQQHCVTPSKMYPMLSRLATIGNLSICCLAASMIALIYCAQVSATAHWQVTWTAWYALLHTKQFAAH